MVKNILVTGGAGFIGSYVNKLLHQAGYETIILDNLSTGSRSVVRQGTFVEGNCGDVEVLKSLFSQYPIDAVMHFAALIDVGESISKPALYYENNVAGTLNLLKMMNQFDVKKLIFSSSAAVYGNPQQELPIKETDPCLPINPYGESKLMVEKILRDCDRAYQLKSCSLRYFNAAGGDPDGEIKFEKKHISNLIPLILRGIKSSVPLTIYGTDYPTKDGTCIRDYIHIHDLATAHLLALEKLFQGGKTDCFNLGNGSGFSVREVIAAAEKVTGIQVQVIEGARRPGDPPLLIADSQKAQRDLNWKTRYPDLETIIAHAWQAMNPSLKQQANR